MNRSVLTFILRASAMMIAMLLGMVLYALWHTMAGQDAGQMPMGVESHELTMATAMSLPMAGWMILTRHRWLEILEMTAAMYACVAALLGLGRVGLIGEELIVALGHPLMLISMLSLMLARRQRYLGQPDRSPLPKG